MLNIIPSKISIVNFKIFFRLFYLLGWIVLGLSIQTMHANPSDGVVSAGQATINSQANYTEITQQSERAVIDWGKFDITANEHTNFQQPSSNAVTLNRIHSDEASNINGRLTANGKLILINQNGIMFGRDAKVDVNGLLATTSNISNQRFMEEIQSKQRQLLFKQTGKRDAAIVNEGEINAAKGLVGLVAPRVVNSGIIKAKVGKVVLATGDKFTLDLYGDRLLNIAISDEKQQQLLMNSGQIIADGGEVLLTSSAGKNIVDSLIINTGLLAARHVEERDGKIIIFAEGSNAVKGNIARNKGKKQGSSKVLVRGMVDVSGINPGEKGGLVQISGDEVVLSHTLIDASGYAGKAGTTVRLGKSAKRAGSAGGEILIGGDYLGKGKVPTAERLLVDRDVVILNDAIEKGDAGRNIFWSDGVTSFHGKVFARALGGKGLSEPREEDGSDSANPTLGGNVGDGGFVETSGKKKLEAGGYVNLLASNGVTGTYLLDPSDITIYGNVTPQFASTNANIDISGKLKMWVDASDEAQVTLSYNTLSSMSTTFANITATGGTGANSISVNTVNGLAIGARIKLGGSSSSYTAATTQNVDPASNIYTISSISGTSLDITPSLSQNYNGVMLYQGYILKINDKSGNSNHFSQSTAAYMPIWLSNGFNNLGSANFNGAGSNSQPPGVYFNVPTTLMNQQNAFSYFFSYYTKSDNTNWSRFFDFGESSSTRKFLFFGASYGGNTSIPGFDNGIASYQFSEKTPLNNPHVFNVRWSANEGNIRLDRKSKVTASNNLITPSSMVQNYHYIGKSAFNADGYLVGNLPEAIVYNVFLNNTELSLIEQYQASKWGVTIDPTITAADSIFTTRYLELLSKSSDIVLSANNVNFDLKGDSINIANDKNLTITTTGIINAVSTGTINANRVTTGGNIIINASGTTASDLSKLNLNSNGGNINATFNGSVSLGKIKAGSILVNAQGSNSDLSIANSKSLETTNSNNISPLILVAGGNFYNNNPPGATVLTTATNTYWRIYSTIPANNLGVSYEYLGASLTKSNSTYNSSAVPTDPSNLLLYSHYFLDINPNVNKVEIFYGDPISSITSKIDGYTYTGYIAPDTASNDTIIGQPSITTTYVPGSSIGNYNITIGQGTLQSSLGYIFNPQTITGFVKVNPISLGATLKDNITKVYDGTSNLNLAGNYDLTGLITYNGVTDQVELVAGEGGYDNKTIGEGKTINLRNLTISGTKSSNYTLAVNTLTSTTGIITKALLTPNLKSNISKVYDGTNTAFLVNAVDLSNNYNLNGLVHGDVVSLTAVNGSYDTKDVGDRNKTIEFDNLTINGTDVNNYELSNTMISRNDASITKKLLMVTAEPKSKTYGSADPGLTYTVKPEDLVGGDSVDVVTGALIRESGEDVGSYAIIQDPQQPLNANNYQINFVGDFLTIEQGIIKGTLTINLSEAINLSYGDPVPVGSDLPIILNGYVESDSMATDTITGSAEISTDYIQGSSVGDYNININPGTLQSSLGYIFNLTTTTGLIKVNPKALTIGLIGSVIKTYDGNDAAILTGSNYTNSDSMGNLNTAAGVIGTDLVTLTGYTNGTYNNKDVEAGKMVTVSDLGVNNSNYSVSNNLSANIGSITSRTLKIKAITVEKNYGENDPAEFPYSISTTDGLVNGDAPSIITGSLQRSSPENQNVGTYPIINNLSAPNYTIEYEEADFIIKARKLGISAIAKNKVYGESDPAEFPYIISTIDGLVNEDQPSIIIGTLQRSSPENQNVGTYSIINNLSAPNYYIEYIGADFNITPSKLGITAIAKNKIYGENDPTYFPYTISTANGLSLVNGDQPSIITGLLQRSSPENQNVGTYPIINNLSAPNYHIEYTGANFTINKRPITVKADAASKVYGDSDPTFTYKITVGNLVSTDTLKGRLKRVAGEEVSGSPYEINIGNLNNSNYALSYESNKFTINPRLITIQVDPVVKTYGDPDPTFTYKIIS